ncbi:PAS domain-containing sensor histidine kinase [Sphingobium sp. CR2-8]|uniref:PAS domain-containing sensor histidine kinase n=1 Tax=Sphingobium sp. CR2-8 TaxID=1306534 RepID=UPI002DB7085A|nr:PAS domain-containing sensor histidine kinase [Sphingobium sp. CR2-8]MEC3909043.1 PAS domain-containing sensor histidine kinase [Sphingobium sp. CR2-8]
MPDRDTCNAPSGTPIEDFEDLFENAPCGYLSTDGRGCVVRANRTFADWMGSSTESFEGRRFADLLPIVGKVFYETHLAPSLHMHGKISEVALDLVRADGTKMPVLLNAVERPGTDERPTFIRFTIFRATERRLYEKGLLADRNFARAEVAAERDISELRDQFIAVLGHDLRNPLASIASGLRLLDKETLSARGQKVTNLMEGSVMRAVGLIDNVLDFARGRFGGGLTLARNMNEPLEPTLRQVVGELRSVTHERTIETDYDLVEPIDCDPARIAQMLSNLVGNAVTHGAADQPIRVVAKTEEGFLEISVANGGEPISDAAQARLFQPFFRGELGPSREGLGLGLHIASEIAEAHGGTLTVASDAAETRFTFRMPLAG